MKRCIILLLLLTCAYARAQDHGFQIRDRNIIWQKVFVSDLDSAAIMQAISLSGSFSDLQGKSLRVLPHEIDYRAAGYVRGRVPMVFLASLLSGHAVIEFRPGRYRVTVDHLILTENMTTSLFEKGRERALEGIALNRAGEMKQSFLESVDILDVDLSQIFTFKTIEKEDW